MYRTLSLLTPSGHLTLGNLLGALRPMAAGQRDADCFYGIADLHALTTPHDPARLRTLVRETATLLLAAGLDDVDAVRAEPGPGARPARLPARVHGLHR